MLDHTVGVDSQACDTLGLLFQVREYVHASGIPPAEEGLALLVCPFDKGEARCKKLLVNRLHALRGEGASVRDFLHAIGVRPAMQHAAWSELLLEPRILRTVGPPTFPPPTSAPPPSHPSAHATPTS